MKADAIWRPVSTFHRFIHSLFDCLLLVFVLNLTFQPLVEPDLGWHLRAGLDLLANGWVLPDTDPYSHTMPDWRWVEHAWLTDGVLALVYRALGSFGALGLIVFFGLVTALAWWVAADQAAVARTYRLIVMVASLWVALPFLGARTQLISLLGVAILLWLWRKIQERGRPWMWMLPPFFLLWANLHGGFTAGLFLFGVMVGGSLLERLCLDRWPFLGAWCEEPVLSWRDLRHCLLVLGIALAVTCLNPYGWRLFSEIYESLTDRFMIETLREWQPVSFQGWAGRTYGLYLTGLAGLVIGWYRRVEPVRWMMLVSMLALSLVHWRNVTLFLVVSLPLAAELLALAVTSVLQRVPFLRAASDMLVLVLIGLTSTALGRLGPEHVLHVWQSGTAVEDYFTQTDYPIEAVRWIRDHREQAGSRLYNDYAYGGFLLWQLPGEKIFIDGRMPGWRIGDRRIFQDYMNLNRSGKPELAILDRYGVDWALIPRGSTLALALDGHPAWRTIYTDAKVVILRRSV